jgi:hypothetical protein
MILQPDWLNTTPVFYPKTAPGQLFDRDGLQLYWKYGYSVFGATVDPSQGFLLPWETADTKHGKRSSAEELDPVLNWLAGSNQLAETEIFEAFRHRVQNFANNHDGLVVVPLSGGLDSRLIVWALRGIDAKKIRTYSYGTSWPQERSSECHIARMIAETEGLKWEQIELGNFLGLTSDSYKITSHYSHAHSMYHIEFYSKIAEKHKGDCLAVISGSVGDLWAGNAKPEPFMKPTDLESIRYSHGLHGSKRDLLHAERLTESEISFFESIRERSVDRVWRTAFQVQNKMMLLRYLADVPKSLGFEVLTPFHDIDIALSMTMLNADRRRNRIWQREFLASHGLGPDRAVRGTGSNSLLFQSRVASKLQVSEPPRSMFEFFKPEFLLRTVQANCEPARAKFLNLTTLGGSRKSAVLNVYGLSKTLASLRDGMMLEPLIRFAKAQETKNLEPSSSL